MQEREKYNICLQNVAEWFKVTYNRNALRTSVSVLHGNSICVQVQNVQPA